MSETLLYTMRWSDQSIEQAIQTAKDKNAIFVVYVEDDMKPSPFHSIIENSIVTNLLMNDQFVGIRIRGSSQSYRDFASIYQLVPIPSLFFIGRNGWPLEIIAGELPYDAVVQRIQNILGQSCEDIESSSTDLHLDGIRSDEHLSSTASTYTVSATGTTTTTLVSLPSDEEILLSRNVNAVQSEIQMNPQLSDISMLSSAASDGPISTEASTAASYTTSEILSHALRHNPASVESNNSKSDLGENEETRNRLSESSSDDLRAKRDNSQLEFRYFQQDSTSPSCAASLRSGLSLPLASGQHDTTARTTNDCLPDPEPVTGFLATFGKWMRSLLGGNATTSLGSQTTLDLRRSESESDIEPNSNSLESEPSTSVLGGHEFAHIQFRLPDGSTHSRMFMARTTMSEVRQYVQNNIALPFRDFDLSTSYPRIVFTNEHLRSTVSGLGLVPRSVILILPVAESSRSSYSVATNVLWTLFAWPFSAVYSLVEHVSIWFHGGTEATVNDEVTSQQPRSRAEQPPRSQNPSFGNVSGARRRLPSSSTVQRDGNIYRLSNRQDDSEDENNTWNGNSTQQK